MVYCTGNMLVDIAAYTVGIYIFIMHTQYLCNGYRYCSTRPFNLSLCSKQWHQIMFLNNFKGALVTMSRMNIMSKLVKSFRVALKILQAETNVTN